MGAAINGCGTAYGDVDGDGDLDIVSARRDVGIQILRNDSSSTNTWLQVAVFPLHAAPGARITVTSGETRQVATIQAGRSYLTSSPPIAAFGQGQDTQVDSIEVVFPDGMQALQASPEVTKVVSIWHPLFGRGAAAASREAAAGGAGAEGEPN